MRKAEPTWGLTMYYRGCLAALMGALVGPLIVWSFPVWNGARLAVLIGVALALILMSTGSARNKTGGCWLLFFWVLIHHPGPPAGASLAGRVLHKVGSGFGSALLLTNQGQVYAVLGRLSAGDGVRVSCRAQISLFGRKVCFARPLQKNQSNVPGILQRRLLRLGPTVQMWIRTTLLGDGSVVSMTRKQTFKQTGLYHLLVVSGFHISLVAALVRWVSAAPLWILNLARCTPPGWWRWGRLVSDAFALVFVWGFATVVGLGCPAQRAAICYSLAGIGIKKNRISLGLMIQAALFPAGWYSLSNAMSWACYALIICIPGSSIGNTIVRVMAFSFSCWVLLGSFAPMGVVANLVLAPWLALLILWGCVALMLPSWSTCSEWLRTSVVATEDLMAAWSEWGTYHETEFGLARWLGLIFLLVFLWLNLKPCKLGEKLLS